MFFGDPLATILEQFRQFLDNPLSNDQPEERRLQSAGKSIEKASVRYLLCELGFSDAEIDEILKTHPSGKEGKAFLVLSSAAATLSEQTLRSAIDSRQYFFETLAGLHGRSDYRLFEFIDSMVGASKIKPDELDERIHQVERDLGAAWLKLCGLKTASQRRAIRECIPDKPKSSFSDPEPLTAGTSSSPLAASHASGSSDGGHILD